MTTKSEAAAVPAADPTTDRELTITRLLDAPLDMVFRAWTSADHMRQWFGPKDFSVTDVQLDFQPGGAWTSRMMSPEGRVHRMGGIYREIIANKRLVFTHAWVDADDKPGLETLITVTFADANGKTRLTFHQATFDTVSDRDSHLHGWGECMVRLAGFAENDPTANREIVTSRLLDATRDLVFKVWSDPQHIGQWWGPTGFTTTTSVMDFRPGGRWRFVMHGPDGRDYQNLIIYDEINAPERLVYHHSNEEDVSDVIFKTLVTFTEEDGKTRVTMRATFPTAAERDRVTQEYGAVEGGQQTLSRLAAYVEQK